MHIFEDSQDAPLVSQVLAGNMLAFEALIQRYQNVLYTVALGMFGDRDRAREATRTAFVRAYTELSTHDPEYGFFSAAHLSTVNRQREVLYRRSWGSCLMPRYRLRQDGA
jgi:DNA-directed RNA polymerase specialized sigma24 family protein